MSSLILPLTVESRKIVFLELSERSTFPNDVEDDFVVRLPEPPVQQNDLLILRKNNVVQALEIGLKDIPIKDFSASLEIIADDIVELRLSGSPGQVIGEVSTPSGRRVSLIQSDDFIKLSYLNGLGTTQTEQLRVRIRIEIKQSNRLNTYYAFLRFQVVQKAIIRFLALDFGSEASQMREAQYAPGVALALMPQVTNLFRLIRKKYQTVDNNELAEDLFEQFETPSLYKSVFYANKEQNVSEAAEVLMGNPVYKLNGGIRMIVPTTEVNTGNNEFLQTHVKIPNLKLVRNSDILGNVAEFSLTEGAQVTQKTLGQIRGSLYMSLLRNMLDAYLAQMQETGRFLRLTLLVPNIYQAEDIRATKKVIKNILDGYVAAKTLHGFEVDCLSESDASFLGAVPKFNVVRNHYYIVVDCGKGTTDYSLVEMEDGTASVCRPLYRNGFAGAGNYITYAFIKAALHYLIHDYFTDKYKIEKVKEFLETRFREKDVFFHSELFRIAESWKIAYSEMLFPDRGPIEALWKKAKTGDITLHDCFDGQLTNSTKQDFLEILKTIPCAWDWNGYVSRAISDVVGDIVTQLTPVIVHQNKHAKCGGIIITGRGAYFKPLAEAITQAIQQIGGMKQVNRIDLSKTDLKAVCLDGIFNHSVRYYADLTATPIEVHKNTMKQVTKGENSWWKRLFGSGGGSGTAYDPDLNAIEVVNTGNLLNTGILIGGTLFGFGGVELTNSNSTLHLIPMRDGVLLLEKDQEGRVVQQHLLEAGGLNSTDEQRTLDSLYPNWHRTSILKNL